MDNWVDTVDKKFENSKNLRSLHNLPGLFSGSGDISINPGLHWHLYVSNAFKHNAFLSHLLSLVQAEYTEK